LDNTLGQAKVQAMRERIAHINPACDVRCVEEFVDADNWPDIAALDMDADGPVSIIDACDQVKAKTAMAAWALQHNAMHASPQKINFISVGAAGGKRHAHKVEIDDLSLTTHDPLLAQLRYRLRKEKGAARQGNIGVTCVFSRESVMQPGAASAQNNPAATDGMAPDVIDGQSDGSLNCHGYGSVVSVTSTFGICAAGWVLFKIAE
jgi:tRNA A37 threonylcarbamoyladenosine dehydratase